jgi:hypothetical protein
VHFTIEEIPCIPSRSNHSLEPGNLAKQIACHHLCPIHTLLPLVGPLPIVMCVLINRATFFGHLSKVFFSLRSACIPPPICLHPSSPSSTRP